MSESILGRAFNRLRHMIHLWSIAREKTQTTMLFAPTFVKKESAGKRTVHCELLISVLDGSHMTSSEGVIFDSPEQLRRLADQLSSNVQYIRRIAADLEDRQDELKADQRQSRSV